MRDYLFRGKTLHSNYIRKRHYCPDEDRLKLSSFYYAKSDFVFGSLVVKGVADRCFIIVHEEVKHYNGYKHFYFEIEVDPETVGQFTGREDLTGNKIYEGDIVLGNACIWKRAKEIYFRDKFVVEWHEKLALFHIKPLGVYTLEIGHWDLEKIGNIYDNPELLEER